MNKCLDISANKENLHMSLHIVACLASHLNASLLDATMLQPLLLPSLVFKVLKSWRIANPRFAHNITLA